MKKTNIISWLDKQIEGLIAGIDSEEKLEKELKTLDKLVSLRKKYESRLNLIEEQLRVMERFILFVRDQHPKDLPKLKKICKDFLEKGSLESYDA
ncbi:MAG: hypothetical protein ACRCS8_02050 [Brevinema sp.]